MARTRRAAQKAINEEAPEAKMDIEVMEQEPANDPPKRSPRKRREIKKVYKDVEKVASPPKKAVRGRARKGSKPGAKAEMEEKEVVAPKRKLKDVDVKRDRFIVDHDVGFSPVQADEPEILHAGNSERESDYLSADENLVDSRPSSRTSHATFTIEANIAEKAEEKAIKRKGLPARGHKEEETVVPAPSLAESDESRATFVMEANRDKENFNEKKAKLTKKKAGPMPPGERFRNAHAKLTAAGEFIGDRLDRIAKHREVYVNDSRGVFERLATPKAVVKRVGRRAANDAPGYDFGDGKQRPSLDFGSQGTVFSAGTRDQSTTATRPATPRPIKRNVDVKKLTKQSRIPLAVRRETKAIEQAEVRDEIHFINRKIMTPVLTVPTTNQTISRLATPKSELQRGEATRRAKEGRVFAKLRQVHPLIDTTNLSDKLYRQAVELGLISKVNGQMAFHDEIYHELLENASGKRETLLLNDIYAKIQKK
ncbi:unnamed protein product, partial [Mesorhabditis belari]|uniref:Uncharacterized protein n=1 Tax=Mesorhabditis belari TaxID=2138241 RepID=A0AAF3FEK3_9BILA